MLFECGLQQARGEEFCLGECPARAAGVFEYVRVEREDERPPDDPSAVDVGVLDMNHGWPNIGHDAIVMGIQTMACEIREELLAAGLRVRAVSYDVRRGGVIPPAPATGSDGGVFVGTGGPGHLDPRRNDGVSEGSQTIAENPAWEAPLFALVRRRARASAGGAARHLSHVRRDVPLAAARRARAARAGKRREERRRDRQPADARGQRASLVSAPDRRVAGRPAHPHPRQPALRPDPRRGRARPARHRRPVARNARPGRPARRQPHDDRSGARRERRDAADPRRQSSPRNREPHARPDGPLAEARPRRSDSPVVRRARPRDDPDAAGRGLRPAARSHVTLHARRAAALPPLPSDPPARRTHSAGRPRCTRIA